MPQLAGSIKQLAHDAKVKDLLGMPTEAKKVS
jgi:hypothetical protein